MPTLQGSLRHVERVCATSGDARKLREEALEALRELVRFDAWVWVVTDPVTTVGVSPVARVPTFDDLPTTIRLKYQNDVHRWTAIVREGRRVGILSRAGEAATPGGLAWRGFLEQHGVGDVASVVFADRYGTWAFLDLWRTGTHPFTDADAALLSAITEPLTTALRSRVAKTFQVPDRDAARVLGPVVAVLDDHLRLVGQTPASDTWLEQLLPPSAGHSPVPAGIYNVGAQLLAVEQGVDLHPPAASAHLVNGLWVTLRAARLRHVVGGDGSGGTIAVTIEEATAEDRTEVFGRAFGLTPREAELVRELAGGADTRELGRTLGISHYTVQDHLKSVFAKTAAPTRQVLVARATGR